jgi:hypothetical protein
LNGNPVVVDLDFNALGLLPVLINQIAQNHDGHAENRTDGVEQVPAHVLATPDEPEKEQQDAGADGGMDNRRDNTAAD